MEVSRVRRVGAESNKTWLRDHKYFHCHQLYNVGTRASYDIHGALKNDRVLHLL